MNRIKTVFGVLILLLGFAMICLCGYLIFRNEQESRAAAQAVTDDLPQLKEQIAAQAGDPDNTLYQRFLLGDAYSSADTAPDEADTVIPLDGYSYLGYLTFLTLGMELPVMDTWDAQRLRRAPCRYYGSAETHDLVIAAHNYRSSFGQCRNLQIGDEIRFTDAAGIVHKYTVGEIEIVEPNAVEYMIRSDWNLSLYTCTYSGTQRLTIRCTEQRDAAEPLSENAM